MFGSKEALPIGDEAEGLIDRIIRIDFFAANFPIGLSQDISVGFAQDAPKLRLMPRAEVHEFASFAGFENFFDRSSDS
jgi:hypothetical protein